MGVLQATWPIPVSDALEQRILEMVRRKMTGPVTMYVNAIRAMEAAYGPEVRDVVRQYGERLSLERSAARGQAAEDRSLRAFCAALEQGCVGSHEWVKLEDTDTRQAYRFTRCAWAEVFRALGAEDIGIWICEGDGPAAAAFNPAIRFQRTRTLMEGADCCDHVYYLET